MEPRDEQREAAPSLGSYSKHLSNGAAVGGQPTVTVQLMCVDSADVIYSLFFASAVLTDELPSASGTQRIMRAAQAHHERLLTSEGPFSACSGLLFSPPLTPK